MGSVSLLVGLDVEDVFSKLAIAVGVNVHTTFDEQNRLLKYACSDEMDKTNKRKLEQSLFMRCSHCGMCCEKTEMPLSTADVERLEREGYGRQKFACYDRYGLVRLKNRHGFCVFYNVKKSNCKIYKHRPLGCRIYPIIYSEQEGITVDDLCPMKNTVSKIELKRKGTKLMELLQRIDNEAKEWRSPYTRAKYL